MSHKIQPEMRVMKDGDSWCFVLPDFENLQVSSAIFIKEEDTNMDTIYEELREMWSPNR